MIDVWKRNAIKSVKFFKWNTDCKKNILKNGYYQTVHPPPPSSFQPPPSSLNTLNNIWTKILHVVEQFPQI